MRAYGIDVTSSPSRRKPVTCAVCKIDGERLRCERVLRWPSKGFTDFEALLASDGPWIMGIDTPFGLASTFIGNTRWPADWAAYVNVVGKMSRSEFRGFLDRYRQPRSQGDKEHKREVDRLAGSMSAQNRRVNGMFYEVTPRILSSGAHIPLLRPNAQSDRIIVETYPGCLARGLIGRNGYKDASTTAERTAQRALRQQIFECLYWVDAPGSIVDDPSGDELDALLCAVQAAWAWSKKDANFGIPETADPLEGWIVDQSLYEAAT